LKAAHFLRRENLKSGGKSGSFNSGKDIDEEKRSKREFGIIAYAFPFHLPYSIFPIPDFSEI